MNTLSEEILNSDVNRNDQNAIIPNDNVPNSTNLNSKQDKENYPVPSDVVANSNNLDIESGNDMLVFSQTVRLNFIRKVYGILSAQLLVTIIICCLNVFTSVRRFSIENIWLFFTCLVLSLIISITLICFKQYARTSPTNYILLTIWTLLQSYCLMFLSLFNVKIVLLSASLTIAVTLSLTYYAYTTEEDYTFMGGILFSMLANFIVVGVFMIAFPQFMEPINVLYSTIGVLLYSTYLIYDTQLIMGKYGVEYDIDDYIIAAMMVYCDILEIFLHILRILAELSR